MAKFRGNNMAFGAPGVEPHWTHGNKEGIGTSYSSASRIWFTIWQGILTEVYYPTVDRPQMRDLQFLFVDGDGAFWKRSAILITKSNRSMELRVTALSDTMLAVVSRSLRR